MSDLPSPAYLDHAGRAPFAYRWWHAAMFWIAVNAPGQAFPWREALFPGFRAPELRPPGEVFPVIWFVITACMLWAGLRVLNRTSLARRRWHICLQAGFWLAYAVFPAVFFGLASPIAGGVLTLAIFVLALAEFWMLRRDDRRSSWLVLPLLVWAGFAGLYVAPMQILLNPDPVFGTQAPLPLSPSGV